jgi:dihydropteroate synthase
MGILNVTPDSFWDGGQWFETQQAIMRGHEMIAEGADIVDVGGESTRPGASEVPVDEELARVVPVVEALAGRVRVSIDTTKAAVADAAVAAGATLINDVSATLWPVAAGTAWDGWPCTAKGTPPRCSGPPLRRRGGRGVRPAGDWAARAAAPGWTSLDRPGHRLRQDRRAQPPAARRPGRAGGHRHPGAGRHQSQGLPGRTGRDGTPAPVGERLEGSLATATWAMQQGAAMVRVHDVAATVQAACWSVARVRIRGTGA